MKNKADRPRAPFAVKLLNVLIAVFLLVAVILFGAMVKEIRQVYSRDPYDSISWYLQDGAYGSMAGEYYRRAFDISPFSSPWEEEYHLAAYADAAFRYQFFDTIGNAEQAERFAGRMASERALTGSLSGETDTVDEILEQIPLHR